MRLPRTSRGTGTAKVFEEKPRYGAVRTHGVVVALALLALLALCAGCRAADPAHPALPNDPSNEIPQAATSSASSAASGQAAPGAGGTPEYGGWLRLVEVADPQSLNFVRSQDRFGHVLAVLIGDTLVQHDATGTIIGRLAESWDWSEDRRVITFRLRSGPRWHDGEPVTSRDAVYTVERILDPSSQATSSFAKFETIEKIEAPDAATLRVTYREPYPAALDAWADTALIPEHRYARYENFLDNPEARSPTGCGPFRFGSWKKAQELVLVANDDYWDGRPYLDRIVFKIIPQDTTRLQSLRIGEIDVMAMTPSQYREDFKGSDFETRLRVASYTIPYIWYIGWNMDGSNPFFSERRVRQAMTWALDRPGFIETIWHGLAVPASSHITPGTWAHDPSVKPYGYDPERARALLGEAGWTDTDGDGVRDRDGKPFRFRLMYPATGRTNDEIAAFFQDNLRKVGVSVKLERLEFKTMLDRLSSHGFEAVMSGMSLDVDPDPYDLFHSSQTGSGLNHASYANAEMDRLSEEGRRSFDTDRRREIYARVQRILSEDQPLTFVFHPSANVAIDRRFRGVSIGPRGLGQFWPSFARWWVPSSEQRFARETETSNDPSVSSAPAGPAEHDEPAKSASSGGASG